MKALKLFLIPKLLSLIAIISIAFLFTSCKKDNEDDTMGTAFVSVTNAVEGSAAQDFYLDNSKINTSAVAYAQTSNYMAATAGNRKVELRNSGSANVTSSFNLTMQEGRHYSVYFTGTATSSSAFATEDDLTAPPAGKAKVRFVHLSSAAASSIDLAITGGSKIVSGLAYKAASAYSTVDANTNFMLYAAGTTTLGLSIPATIQAGKIYTIYISGSTTTTISYHVVAQN